MSQSQAPEFLQIQEQELQSLLERISPLIDEEDFSLIEKIINALDLFNDLLQDKSISISRLRTMIFGPHTEKTRKILKMGSDKAKGYKDSQLPKDKPKGHGRNGANDYPGAKSVSVKHPKLKAQDTCPKCNEGKLAKLKETGKVIRISAQPFLPATLYKPEKLRCNLCGELFRAPLPEHVGPDKYEPGVSSMLGLLHYGNGMPFYRLAKLQENLGVPMPASTQYEQIEKLAVIAKPVFDHLIIEAAQAELFYNDDTNMRVLELKAQIESQVQSADPKEPQRTGIFTTGIIACTPKHQIAIFYTGNHHAGEHLNELLKKRDCQLDAPIQMCDGLSRNIPKDFKTILANCLTHGRRNFVDIFNSFPEPTQVVLLHFRDIYINDAEAKKNQLSDQQRLEFHQEKSQPIMDKFHKWMKEQLDEKKVEENSDLGKAIKYMLKRWEPLTLFLRKPGAPLDNNLCEQILKRSILHRKNSLFYKTENGAKVGDLFMSLIETCRFEQINAFEYLKGLETNADRVKENPEKWMPWNYKENQETNDTS